MPEAASDRTEESTEQRDSGESGVQTVGEDEQPDILGQLGVDLTEMALAQGSPDVNLWSEEIGRVKQVLGKRHRHGVILVGPEGVGKRGLVMQLARELSRGDGPPHVRGRRVIELPFHRVIAGVRQQGDFERIVFYAMRQAGQSRDVVLFFGDLPSFMGASGDGRRLFDASYAMEMALHQPDLFLLGSATPVAYSTATATSSWLARGTTRVDVPEPSRESTVALLKRFTPVLSEYHGVQFEREVVQAAVDLSDYFVKERVLPGKAMELLDEAAAGAVMRGGDGGKLHVDVDDVTAALSEWVGIPTEKLAGVVNRDLLDLEGVLSQRVKGQDRCIRKLADVIRVSRMELNARPQRPDGVFLFVGPSGVGKSELARALADELYGGSGRLFEFNMTRYADDDGIARLAGVRLGEIAQAGELTSIMERCPHSVVVFEEVERSHRDVAVMLMQIFRNGRFVDGLGREIDFSNAVLIMTTNSENIVPGDEDNGAVGFGSTAVGREERYLKQIRTGIEKVFPSEFMEGVDEVLLFEPLSEEALVEIVELHLEDVRRRLEERSVRLEVTETAMRTIVAKGHSREYGARNLGRTVEGLVLKPLARFLLANPTVTAVRVSEIEGDIEVQAAS